MVDGNMTPVFQQTNTEHFHGSALDQVLAEASEWSSTKENSSNWLKCTKDQVLHKQSKWHYQSDRMVAHHFRMGRNPLPCSLSCLFCPGRVNE
jgi:hypothetical protein